MSIRETSGYESTNEFRGRIGLQFFAEGEDGGAGGADMDGDFGSDFEAGLLGDTLENQQSAEQDDGEGAANGLENQQPGGQQGEPENQPPDKVNSSAGAREGALGQGGVQQEGQPPAAQQQAWPAPVPMTYNGQQILLPAEAVQALRGALGMDPIELLQKGMNYDRKAERELRLIDQFAQGAGLSRAQYIEQLEAAQRQQELAAEVEKCRAEFPDTPDAALRAIAEGRMAAKRAAAQQQAVQREQQLAAVRQRAANAVEQARQKAEIKAWDDYEQIAGVHTREDIPPRVLELVQKEGMSPVAAHYRYQTEQKDQQLGIQQKAAQNRQQSVGSLAGDAATGGFEADFMKGFGY